MRGRQGGRHLPRGREAAGAGIEWDGSFWRAGKLHTGIGLESGQPQLLEPGICVVPGGRLRDKEYASLALHPLYCSIAWDFPESICFSGPQFPRLKVG